MKAPFLILAAAVSIAACGTADVLAPGTRISVQASVNEAPGHGADVAARPAVIPPCEHPLAAEEQPQAALREHAPHALVIICGK